MQQQIIVVIAALLLAGIAVTAKADDGLPTESRERAFDDCIDKNGGEE